MSWTKVLLLLPVGLMLILASACTYSFQTVSVKPNVKTITIAKMENTASVIVPSLAQEFTERVRDQFINQSSLQLAERNGDLELIGTIIQYNISPLTLQGNDKAAQNRMTISVKVKFTNKKYPDESWDNTFTNFVDFPAETSLVQAESTLLKELTDKLAIDIFNKALSSW